MLSRNQAYSLLAAAACGAVVGAVLAPPVARRRFLRRVEAGLPRLTSVAQTIYDNAHDFATEIATIFSDLATSSVESVRKSAFMLRTPIARLKKSLAKDPVLASRSIWVDAHGDTILLHGVVEDDEEWHTADTLARLVSPDGSVRNLLQVRRRADA